MDAFTRDHINNYNSSYLHEINGRSHCEPYDCSKLFGMSNPLISTIPLCKRSVEVAKNHFVERRMPFSNDILMYPTGLHSLINSNCPTTVQFYDDNGLRVKTRRFSNPTQQLKSVDQRLSSDLPSKLEDCRPFDCEWHSAEEIESCKSLQEATRSSGNVFGGNGLLLVEGCLSQKYPEFKFEDIEHDADFKIFFNGIETFRTNEQSPCFQFPSDGVGVTYYYDNKQNSYIKSYLLDENGANGSFVEKHPFPHVFTPGDKDSIGKVLVGKQCDGAYYFSIVELEYGQALFLPENTVHSDSSTVGNLFVAFTVGTEADTVLVKEKNTLFVMNLYA